MDFKQLKKASTLGDLTEKLLKEAEKMGGANNQKDERIFTVERDKSGVGYSVIRFLPAAAGESSPIVKLYNHGFQENGKWFIENCPTTLGEQCPICASNSVLYNSGIDSKKKIASARKRKLSFYSNVYIVKNPANPELENTVMIFRYGKKIFDKIMSAMKPEFQDETPLDPFDLWNGADFKIKVSTVKESNGNSYPNYDSSSFGNQSSLLDGDDEKLEAIWKQCHPLQDLVSKDKFKTYEELEKRLNFVLGTPTVPTTAPAVQRQEELIDEEFTPSNIMNELESSYLSSKNTLDEDEEELDSNDALKYFSALAD